MRQLATLWCIMEMAEFFKNNSPATFVKAAVDDYRKYVVEEGDYAFLRIKGKAKLAYNAFLILILNKLSTTCKFECSCC